MKNLKLLWAILFILFVTINADDESLIERNLKRKRKSKKSKKNFLIGKPKKIYDSTTSPREPFTRYSDTLEYKNGKYLRRLLNKNYKNPVYRKDISSILEILAVYAMFNEDKITKKPRYLKLSDKEMKSEILNKKLDEMEGRHLMKNEFMAYIDDLYEFKEEDYINAKKLNLYTDKTKRKNRLTELDKLMNDSLSINDLELPKQNNVKLTRKLRPNQKYRSIEDIIYEKSHPIKFTVKAADERMLLQKKNRRYKKNKKHINKKRRKHKKIKDRDLNVELINPRKRRSKRRSIMGMPGGGGVTQGPGVENLKVVINAVGQPSSYLPVEQNDSYEKGYNEQDAAPKVIVTRMQLPGRMGTI